MTHMHDDSFLPFTNLVGRNLRDVIRVEPILCLGGRTLPRFGGLHRARCCLKPKLRWALGAIDPNFFLEYNEGCQSISVQFLDDESIIHAFTWLRTNSLLKLLDGLVTIQRSSIGAIKCGLTAFFLSDVRAARSAFWAVAAVQQIGAS